MIHCDSAYFSGRYFSTHGKFAVSFLVDAFLSNISSLVSIVLSALLILIVWLLTNEWQSDPLPFFLLQPPTRMKSVHRKMTLVPPRSIPTARENQTARENLFDDDRSTFTVSLLDDRKYSSENQVGNSRNAGRIVPPLPLIIDFKERFGERWILLPYVSQIGLM